MACFSLVFIIDLPAIADTIWTGFFQTFVMGILADFETSDFKEHTATYEWFSKVIFMLLMFIVQVVMLNLLIAIMTSTYERVSDLQRITLRASRARVVLRMMSMMSVFTTWYKRFAEKNDIVYSLVPFSSEDRQEDEGWTGHLSALKSHMDMRIKKDFDGFKDELMTLQDDVSQNPAMQEDLAEIRESIGLIMKSMRIKRD